jgi:hypothetical protein
MLPYKVGFGYPRVWFWDELLPESVFGVVSGSGAQRLHPIRIRTVAIPSPTDPHHANLVPSDHPRATLTPL